MFLLIYRSFLTILGINLFLIIYIGNIFSPLITYVLTLSVVYLAEQKSFVLVSSDLSISPPLGAFSDILQKIFLNLRVIKLVFYFPLPPSLLLY